MIAAPCSRCYFSIGLAFALSAIATIVFGPQQQGVQIPSWLLAAYRSRLQISGYRVFLVVSGAVTAAALAYLFDYTLFGARIRAAVDNRVAAEGIGIKVDRLFVTTFAIGTALAGVGGALSIEMLGSIRPSRSNTSRCF